MGRKEEFGSERSFRMKRKKMKFTALLVGITMIVTSSSCGQVKEDTANWVDGNSIYHIFGTQTKEPNFEKQWAFENDGTFIPANEVDDFPIYENPFEDPINWDDFFDWNSDWGSDWGSDWNSDWGSDWGSDWNWDSDWDNLFRDIFETAAKKVSSHLPTAVEGIDINLKKAWEAYQGGDQEVIVAVIDTGVDISHEDLSDAIWINEDEIAGDGIDNDGNGYIDDVYGWNFYDNNNEVFVGEEDSHGTHGAGTIAASINDLGIASIAGNTKVKVMVVKALGGKDGAGTTNSIIQAIHYAEKNGASICNLSFGTSENNRRLYQTIKNSNMLFIAAAGNGDDWTGTGQNSDRIPVYPAAYPLDNIISVANLTIDGTLHSSSNYGTISVDLAAPGSYILSTTPNNQYSYMTGTSMAAPMVTGVAALLYSQDKDITPAQAKEIILASVRPLESLNGLVATGGMLDAYAAITYDKTEIKEPTPTPETKEETQEVSLGTAPEFSFEAYYDYFGKYLVVTVTDKDNDLKAVRYESGEKQAQYFNKGKTGNEIILQEDHTITFQIKYGGIYTFYAIDQNGNETVKTIRVRR